ncbi:MAG TPA: hypothetical protein VNZ45_09580 [Bacteroidia bacterium]|jgi:hypothetical protein|nr:hypothetical protein [Bacteroidia bacterium]
MRQYFRISFIFSLLLLFVGVSGSFVNTHNNISNKATLSIPAHRVVQHYTSENLPNSIIVKIRHRSAEQNESLVLSPNLGIVIEIACPDSPPEYLSKWISYIQFILEDLPNDQTIPSSFSLRAPPFSC